MKTLIKNLNLGTLITLLTLSLTFNSCDQIKEILTVSISTTIEGQIPLQLAYTTNTFPESNLNITKASAINYEISSDISIADNPELYPYLNKIKEIDVRSIQIIFTGLQEGEIIDYITISVVGVGELSSITNVTNTNNSFNPSISSEILKSVSNDLLNKNKISVNIKGGTNGPLNCSVNFKIDTRVKAQALD